MPILPRRALIAAPLAAPFAVHAQSLTAASLRMDWALSGYQLPFYWAKHKGYYEAEGIDMTIRDGAGSARAVQLVSAKEDTFALADTLTTILSASRGMKVRSLLVVVQQGGSAIVSWADRPIRTPQEMAGRSIAAAADQKPLVELFLNANRVPLRDVQIRVVSMQARNTVFLQKQVDGIVSVVIGSPMDMIVAAREGRGQPVHLMPFADFGVRNMATGALGHEDTIASNPGMVRGFTRASLRALAEITNPAMADEATDIAMRLSGAPANRRESVKLQWLATLERLQTENSRGRPLGWTHEADWNGNIELLVQTEQLRAAVPAGQFYTNGFIEG